MNCPRCQHENRSGAKFCEECAAPLPRACVNCGAQLSATAKFCSECAHPATSAAPTASQRFGAPEAYTPRHLAERIINSKAALEGERKQVTVFFADLKGSMELLADRDPEDVRRLLDPVLEHMLEAVHRFEGTVNQVMGDGIMALFGAPVAHEDHAVRACYAALRMQESVKRYAEEIRRQEGITVRIRVGLNSGEVVVRSIGSDLHMDYTAVGQTTHLAARMEQLADPGSILLTRATLALAADFIQVLPQGPTPVKGLSAPVEIYELTGALATRSRFHAHAARGLTRFVGRASEMIQLDEALELARGGRGQIVAVVGEPGVGKSRLFWEFGRSHQTDGCLTLQSASVSYAKATPYLPVIELLRGYFQIEPNDDTRKIREKITGKLLSLDRALEIAEPSLFWLLDVPVENEEWTRLDPNQRRDRTLDALKHLFLRESQIQPLIVVFEDLHWIDGETQAVLDGLVDSLPAARLLVLVNYRPEYRHAWGVKTYYRQLRIDVLPLASAENLLEALLGDDASVQSLGRLLVERTEGNPLFLEESVRTLAETGVLIGEPGAYRLTRTPDSLEIPATAQAIIAGRIDRLEPDDKRLLQAASVLGKDAPFTLLESIADMRADELQQRLGRLQAAEFLYEAQLFPEIEYTFKHALTHEVAYGSVLHERRRYLHGRVVTAIETLYRDRVTEHVDRLAHHAVLGELGEKAVRYLHQSGLRAAGRSAYQQAAVNLEQALALLDDLPEPQRKEQELDLLLALGRALLLGRGYPDPRVEQIYTRAQALATNVSDPGQRFAILRGLWSYWLAKADLVAAERLARDLLAVAEGHQSGNLIAAAHLSLGQTAVHHGSFASAYQHLEQAQRYWESRRSERRTTQDMLVTSLSYAAHALWHLGYPEAAQRRVAEAVTRARELESPYNIAYATFHAATIERYRGDKSATRRWALESIAVSEEHSFPYLRAYAMVLRGWTGGAAEAEEGTEAFRTTGAAIWEVDVLAILGEAYLNAGQIGDALKHFEASLEQSRRTGERWREAEVLRLKSEVMQRVAPEASGETEEILQRALSLAREQGARSLELRVAMSLSRLWKEIGRLNDARHMLAEIYSWFSEGFDAADLRGAKMLLDELSAASR